MRYELNFEAEPFAWHDEFLESFLESFLDQEDFRKPPAKATVTWYGPWPLEGPGDANASSQLDKRPELGRNGVYIVALHDPPRVAGYRPIRVSESNSLPVRLKDYLTSSPRTNPLAKFPPQLSKKKIHFFFGRVQGDRLMVQNAIARIFLRAGVPLSHHDIPRLPAKVLPGAQVKITNVLPEQLKPYLKLTYRAGRRKDPRGQDITGPYPGPQKQNILHLTPSGTPVWEVEAVIGDRDSGRWIRVGNRLIVLGALECQTLFCPTKVGAQSSGVGMT